MATGARADHSVGPRTCVLYSTARKRSREQGQRKQRRRMNGGLRQSRPDRQRSHPRSRPAQSDREPHPSALGTGSRVPEQSGVHPHYRPWALGRLSAHDRAAPQRPCEAGRATRVPGSAGPAPPPPAARTSTPFTTKPSISPEISVLCSHASVMQASSKLGARGPAPEKSAWSICEPRKSRR